MICCGERKFVEIYQYIMNNQLENCKLKAGCILPHLPKSVAGVEEWKVNRYLALFIPK